MFRDAQVLPADTLAIEAPLAKPRLKTTFRPRCARPWIKPKPWSTRPKRSSATANADDAAELKATVQDLRSAIDQRSEEKIRKVSAEVEDLVFYLEDLGGENSAALPSARNPDVGSSPLDVRNQSTTMRCPTCRAVQEWADDCRRCKCDLTFLRAVETRYSLSRRCCLRALRDGRHQEAMLHAQHAHRLHPHQESQQLLAVCALARGDWVTALAMAHAAVLS